MLQELWNILIKKPVSEVVSDFEPTEWFVEKTLDEIKGDINYCMTKLLVTLLKKFGTGYAILSNIRAIPQDVHDEFEEQFMKPYEKKKKEENGEVAPLVV